MRLGSIDGYIENVHVGKLAVLELFEVWQNVWVNARVLLPPGRLLLPCTLDKPNLKIMHRVRLIGTHEGDSPGMMQNVEHSDGVERIFRAVQLTGIVFLRTLAVIHDVLDTENVGQHITIIQTHGNVVQSSPSKHTQNMASNFIPSSVSLLRRR